MQKRKRKSDEFGGVELQSLNALRIIISVPQLYVVTCNTNWKKRVLITHVADEQTFDRSAFAIIMKMINQIKSVNYNHKQCWNKAQETVL